MKKTIGIIGAGPIGLWIAIELCDVFDITIYEKRNEYMRSQTVFTPINLKTNNPLLKYLLNKN